MTHEPTLEKEAPNTPSIVFESVRLKNGRLLRASLEPGVHVFEAEGREPGAEATLEEIGALLTGLRAPRRGRLRVLGHSPHDHPATRRHIASVLAVEPPLIGNTVGEHVERLSSASQKPSLREEHPFVDAWWTRPADALSGTERRLLAAALAFAAPEPKLVLLHEPLGLGPAFPQPVVLDRIRRWRDSRVTVVCTTLSSRVAARLSARTVTLDLGPKPPEPLAAEYLVRSSAAGALAARLADHPAVQALRFEESRPRDLWVRGTDLDRLGGAIEQALLEEGLELYELTRLRRAAKRAAEGDDG